MSIKNLFPKVLGKSGVPVRHFEDDPYITLHRGMNRLFDEFTREFGLAGFESNLGAFSPSIDVRESDTQIQIEAELPGMTESDIDISLSHDRLVISGEKKHQDEHKDGNFHRIERSYGSFRREIGLPCEVEQDSVEAVFKNGVLKINLPKCVAEAQSNRRIPIRTS